MSSRLSSIDFIRTVAILCVITCHYYPLGLFWGSNLGIVGVPIFFVCSGFLITHTISIRGNIFNIGIKDFYVRRFARILPLLTLTIAFGLSITLLSPLSKAFIKTFYLNSFLIFAFTPFFNNWWEIWIIQQPGVAGIQGLFWGILWSLACEFQFYLGFPYLLKSANNLKRLQIVLILIVLIGLISNCLVFIPFWWTNSFSAWSFVSLGVLVALNNKTVAKLTAVLFSVIGFSGLIFCYGFIDYNHRLDASIGPTLIGLSTVLWLFGLTCLNIKLPQWLCTPGRLCYGLYLWHPFALFLTWNNGVLMYGIVSILMAIISFYIFEKPINKSIRNYYNGLPEPPL